LLLKKQKKLEKRGELVVNPPIHLTPLQIQCLHVKNVMLEQKNLCLTANKFYLFTLLMKNYSFLKCVLILFCIYVLSLNIQAQSVDSLWQAWQNVQLEKTERLDAFKDYITLKYINPYYQLDTAMILAQQLEKEGRTLESTCHEGQGIFLQASANLGQHNYLEAAKLYEKSVSTLKGCDFEFPPEYIYLDIGFCYANLGLHNEAIDNYQKSLLILDTLEDDSQKSKSIRYINISRSYHQLGQYQAALDYLQKAKALGI